MSKQTLLSEIDLFAGRIRAASQASEELYGLYGLATQIRDRIAVIQQPVRDAQSFGFISDKVKQDCLKLHDCLEDAHHLLIEIGSRGLRAKAIMQELWRELP